ncbi:MAG: hypothetical protein AB1726_06330 [Planctomycetota bacterium]
MLHPEDSTTAGASRTSESPGYVVEVHHPAPAAEGENVAGAERLFARTGEGSIAVAIHLHARPPVLRRARGDEPPGSARDGERARPPSRLARGRPGRRLDGLAGRESLLPPRPEDERGERPLAAGREQDGGEGQAARMPARVVVRGGGGEVAPAGPERRERARDIHRSAQPLLDHPGRAELLRGGRIAADEEHAPRPERSEGPARLLRAPVPPEREEGLAPARREDRRGEEAGALPRAAGDRALRLLRAGGGDPRRGGAARRHLAADPPDAGRREAREEVERLGPPWRGGIHGEREGTAASHPGRRRHRAEERELRGIRRRGVRGERHHEDLRGAAGGRCSRGGRRRAGERQREERGNRGGDQRVPPSAPASGPRRQQR